MANANDKNHKGNRRRSPKDENEHKRLKDFECDTGPKSDRMAQVHNGDGRERTKENQS
jgi:hypothetical protein